MPRPVSKNCHSDTVERSDTMEEPAGLGSKVRELDLPAFCTLLVG